MSQVRKPKNLVFRISVTEVKEIIIPSDLTDEETQGISKLGVTIRDRV